MPISLATSAQCQHEVIGPPVVHVPFAADAYRCKSKQAWHAKRAVQCALQCTCRLRCNKTISATCSLLVMPCTSMYRSKDISAEMWLEELNDAITRATGLDQLGLPQAPLDEEDLTEAELLEQQRVLAEDSAAAAPQLA